MWNLLDSESTDHFFYNSSLLTDIKDVPNGDMLRMHSSGGHIDTTKKGMFGSLPVWYHPNALGNVLSLALLQEKCTVEFNSRIENAFNVHLNPTTILKFTCQAPGLYVYDATNL